MQPLYTISNQTETNFCPSLHVLTVLGEGSCHSEGKGDKRAER
jgi:hypothetical protein